MSKTKIFKDKCETCGKEIVTLHLRQTKMLMLQHYLTHRLDKDEELN